MNSETDAIEEAIEAGRWREAQELYVMLATQGNWGVIGCRSMVQVKAKAKTN